MFTCVCVCVCVRARVLLVIEVGDTSLRITLPHTCMDNLQVEDKRIEEGKTFDPPPPNSN